jgi:hypothetical protein
MAIDQEAVEWRRRLALAPDLDIATAGPALAIAEKGSGLGRRNSTRKDRRPQYIHHRRH